MSQKNIALMALLFLSCCLLSSCSSFSFGQDYNYRPNPKLWSAWVGCTGYQRVPGGFIGGEGWHGQVELYKSGVQRGKYSYPLKATNMDPDAFWTGPGKVTVRFYDYPDGVNIGDKEEKKARKLIGTFHYRYDQHAGTFVELAPGK